MWYPPYHKDEKGNNRVLTQSEFGTGTFERMEIPRPAYDALTEVMVAAKAMLADYPITCEPLFHFVNNRFPPEAVADEVEMEEGQESDEPEDNDSDGQASLSPQAKPNTLSPGHRDGGPLLT